MIEGEVAHLPVDASSVELDRSRCRSECADDGADRLVVELEARQLGEDRLLPRLVAALDMRGKLSRQIMPPHAWLVVYGAGGSFPAAAYQRIVDFGPEPPVLDQTLYWMVVD